LADHHEYIREHAEKAGRSDRIDVAPYVPAAVDDDPEAAKDVIRGHVAYYVGNGTGYERAVGEQFPNEASTIATAWQSGNREAATEAVTDAMVEALGVAGTTEQAQSQFEAVAEIDCVTRPMVTIPSNADEAMIDRTIEALAPSNQ
jgi:alkanesulfonate monooxygenase SsuD/methylene tetrahydromethanopterin reductase-like flavin-dependent oxidoreductase (luciferase family)